MRWTNLGRVRGNWYDRGQTPQTTTTYEATGIAPHGATTRWTYTAPSFRRGYITSRICGIIRTTAAGTAARMVAKMQTSTPIILALTWLDNNAVDANSLVHAPGDCYINSGDAVTGVTSDASTTGTADYVVDARVVEFDVV